MALINEGGMQYRATSRSEPAETLNSDERDAPLVSSRAVLLGAGGEIVTWIEASIIDAPAVSAAQLDEGEA